MTRFSGCAGSVLSSLAEFIIQVNRLPVMCPDGVAVFLDEDPPLISPPESLMFRAALQSTRTGRFFLVCSKHSCR